MTVWMAQNLQMLVGVRFCLGVGAGWDKPEFDVMGIESACPSDGQIGWKTSFLLRKPGSRSRLQPAGPGEHGYPVC